MTKSGPSTKGKLTIRSIRVSQSEVVACLNEMDFRQEDDDRMRRRANRFLFRIANAIIQPEEQGKSVAFIVSTRNVSVGGMSVLHSQMMYQGSPCRVDLATRDGNWMSVHAKVAHCHLVRGMLHEIGLKFDTPIDLNKLSFSPGVRG